VPTEFDDADVPTVRFDLRLEISAFLVFRRLREGKPTLLVDVRPDGETAGLSLAGAVAWDPEMEIPPDRPVVLFDDDGALALAVAEELQAKGHAHVKALFGGLELWEFSLDPEVVGQETFLVRRGP